MAGCEGRVTTTPREANSAPGVSSAPQTRQEVAGAGPGSGRQRCYRSLSVSPRLSPPRCPQCCPSVTAMGDRAPGGPQRARSRVLQLLHLGQVGSTRGCTQRGDTGVFWGHPSPSSPLGFPGGLWALAGATMPIPKQGGAPSPPGVRTPPRDALLGGERGAGGLCARDPPLPPPCPSSPGGGWSPRWLLALLTMVGGSWGDGGRMRGCHRAAVPL